jgi:ABC-type branched-subunit amino acid transport system ATPase component
VTTMPGELRAAFGLGCSFQSARLFPGLTVVETVQVAMGKEAGAGMVASMVPAGWAHRTELQSRHTAREIVDRLGLSAWADTLTTDLSTGTRRICDLAAQIAAHPSVLLLDEPTAGLAQREAEAFGPLVRRIRDELDCSILIVEHDMPLLMRLCDRVYAMAAGRIIASGTPDQVRSDPVVIASYLGTDAAAIERSGARTSVRTTGPGR